MGLINKLRKYMKRIYRINPNNSPLLRSYRSQKEILNKFKEPKNNVERSFFQYQCQMKSVPFMLKLLQNVASSIFLLFYYVKPYKECKSGSKYKNNNEAVFLYEGVTKKIIPDSLGSNYNLIVGSTYNEGFYLGSKEKQFIFTKLFKFWYFPFFCLKNLSKIGIYAYLIHKYNPKAIIVHSEYSYTSSILTEYCNAMEVEHINVMHGEKLFNIRDSFFKFNKFYVWDEHYVNLLTELRADKKQFVIDIPSNINLKVKVLKSYKYDFTYYLGNEGVRELLEIKKNLLELRTPLNKICIRYHPRYSDEDQVRNVFDGFIIEDPSKVSIEESLSLTKSVMSLYSTVLYQAYKNQKQVVIDNLSNKAIYDKLTELKYIMIKKPHYTLSEMIEMEIIEKKNL